MLRLFGGKSRVHYAWVVLGCAVLVSGLNTGIRLSFGVMIDPLVDRFGWSRGAISLAYSLSFISTIPVTLALGGIGERVGIRRILALAALTVCGGLILIGTVTQLWQWYLYYGVVLSAIGGAVSHVLMPVVVTRWFNKKLGLANGLLWASLGLGSVVMAPLLRWGIDTAGWAATFSVLGVGMGIILLIASVLMHDRPESVGLTAYGESAKGTVRPLTQVPTRVETISMGRLRSTRVFWAMVAIHFLGCSGHSPLLAHMVPMATFRGISGTSAALTLSIAAAFSIASRFAMSLVADAKGSRFTFMLAMVLQTLPIFLLFWAKDLWVFYLFATLFGIGYGGEMVGFPIFNRQFYGVSAPLSGIYSYQMAGASLGMAFGGWIGGVLFDLSGAYGWTVAAAIAAGIATMVPIVWLPRHRRTSEPLLAL